MPYNIQVDFTKLAFQTFYTGFISIVEKSCQIPFEQSATIVFHIVYFIHWSFFRSRTIIIYLLSLLGFFTISLIWSSYLLSQGKSSILVLGKCLIMMPFYIWFSIQGVHSFRLIGFLVETKQFTYPEADGFVRVANWILLAFFYLVMRYSGYSLFMSWYNFQKYPIFTQYY